MDAAATSPAAESAQHAALSPEEAVKAAPSAAAEPQWSLEPEVPKPRLRAARAAPGGSVATSLEGFSDSRPSSRVGQSRRAIEDYNRDIATRLKDELVRSRISAGDARLP